MFKDSRMFKDNIQNGLVELGTAWELPILSNFIQFPFSESSAQPEQKKCHRNSGFNLPARQVPGLDKWMQKHGLNASIDCARLLICAHGCSIFGPDQFEPPEIPSHLAMARLLLCALMSIQVLAQSGETGAKATLRGRWVPFIWDVSEATKIEEWRYIHV